ncbi:hypothetical protein FEM48_Zijuj09G0149600 [Ziziphus jujuba var. spinosa]|uniref:Beta-glucosidase 13-like n=1 Tax=Ziziphus jujuba var. spinosa TaxID=714518 RepID=A0A978UTN2_ZIZJJ|nr:hypothetical protein FEM48_Zijuj09G0149600 [Ziziphus jujuba var. spinosa]
MAFSLSTLSPTTSILLSFIGIFAISLAAFWASVEAETVSVNVTAGGINYELEVYDASIAEELKIKSHDFPSDFIFGAGTSAAQIEGSANESGRGQSIWDNLLAKSKAPAARKFPIAIDSYKRYKEDVKHVKDLGVKYYRFSISWGRILPNGTLSGGINQQGIDHYNRLIDELIKNGIVPVVTILHFDFPQILEEKYGGYLSRSFVDDFKDYSEICFKTFGDRVKHWITINEPKVIATYGYEKGWAPPQRCSLPDMKCPNGGNSSTEPYIVAHNLILAHAVVYKLYKQKYELQGGVVGIALNSNYYEPYNKSSEDKEAAKRLLDFHLGWYVEPLVYGDYPKIMRELVKERLPEFSENEKSLLKGSFDFIGMNYYVSSYAQNMKEPPSGILHHSVDSLANELEQKNGLPLGYPVNGSYPQGMEKLLKFMKEKYQSPNIYISENGAYEINVDKLPIEQALKDPHRITYVLRHLNAVRNAIKSGVNVKGYFYWSVFDSFEWGMGLIFRYGFYYIDFNNNLERIPKVSLKWFHDFLQSN